MTPLSYHLRGLWWHVAALAKLAGGRLASLYCAYANLFWAVTCGLCVVWTLFPPVHVAQAVGNACASILNLVVWYYSRPKQTTS